LALEEAVVTPSTLYRENQTSSGFYRRRHPEQTSLYRIVEKHFEEFRDTYKERYQKRYGFWRGVIDDTIEEYLRCGILDHGFARVKCRKCGKEKFVAFSCKKRYFCPSCDKKRSLMFGMKLAGEIALAVPHRQFVFAMPKRFRLYFLYNRKLLGKLAKCGAETVEEVYRAVLGKGRAGQVFSIQTFGDLMNWHPHIHGFVTDGLFDEKGIFHVMPDIPVAPFIKLFSHKVFRLLLDEGLITGRVVQQMRRWPHSGFHVHKDTRIARGDIEGIERLGEYIVRSPFSESRVVKGRTESIIYRSGHAEPQMYLFASQGKTTSKRNFEIFSPLDLLASLVQHIPERRQHMVIYYGMYSSRTRGEKKKREEKEAGGAVEILQNDKEKKKVNRSWAMLIKRVYEIDPLLCDCGGEMKIVAFVNKRSDIKRIMNQVREQENKRGPP